MVSKSIIFFLGLCPIIPLIAHFAEGLIFIAEFWLLFGVGVLSKMLITYFKIDKTAQVITYINLMLAAALYALYCYQPEILTVVTWREMAITGGSVFLFGIVITAICADISVNRFLRMKASELYKI